MGLKEVGERLKNRWQGLSARQKTLSLLTGIPLLAAFAFLLNWVGKTEMAPLFTNLDAKEAAAIVEQLKESQVEYQLADQGATVLVPKKDLYDLRLEMAASGIATGGDMGWELFDRSNLVGLTDFDRNLNYQRALQEELRRTIIQLDEVDQARVHLVLPEKSVFVEEETPPSASVALKLKPGKSLAPQNVRAIVLLVANSVEGLKGENVNVIDMEGNVLSDSLAEESTANLTGSAQKQHEMKQMFERQIESQIQSLLDRIFGPGKAIAVINADLDFALHEKRSITYGRSAVRAETGTGEGAGGIVGGENGIPGVAENVPGYDAIDGAGTEEQVATVPAENLEEYSRTYEVDTTEEKIVFAPGEVKKLSVAVVVDGQLTPVRATEVQNLVIAAVGLQPDRGDQITVSSMIFDTTLKDEMAKSFEEEAQQQEVQEQLQEMRRLQAMLGLGALLAIVVAAVLFRSRRAKRRSSVEVVIDEPVPLSQVEETPTTLTADVIERKRQQEKAKKYLEEQPEQAANILKTWLSYEE